MTDANDLDILADELEVAPSLGSQPRLPLVISALVVAGLLIGLLVIVVVSGVSTLAPSAGVVCNGETSCSGLSLEQVRTLTGIDLPAVGEVVESSYEETAATVTVSARVRLPEAGPNPFDGTAYREIAAPQQSWPTDDLGVIGYFSVSGDPGSLSGEAVYAVDDYMREIVLVTVHRDLG